GARADERARRPQDRRVHGPDGDGARPRRGGAAGLLRRRGRPRARHPRRPRLRQSGRDLPANLLRPGPLHRPGPRPRPAPRTRERRRPGLPRAAPVDRRGAAEALTMRWLAQTIAISGVNLRSLGQRLGSSSVAVVGLAGVVAVFVAVLSIAERFPRVMERGASPDTALVLRAGSDTEMASG